MAMQIHNKIMKTIAIYDNNITEVPNFFLTKENLQFFPSKSQCLGDPIYLKRILLITFTYLRNT